MKTEAAVKKVSSTAMKFGAATLGLAVGSFAGNKISGMTTTVSRKKAIDALISTSDGKGKGVVIEHVDAELEAIDTWTLENAWISDVSFSELTYEDTKISDITIEITYDYASLVSRNPA